LNPIRPKQEVSDELMTSLLEFVERKFYSGDTVNFRKDRKRLMAWAICYPAAYLTKRGVSLPAEKYRELFINIFTDALQHASGKITYRPAWMKHVIQEHFKHHGEKIYEQAKAVRTIAEHLVFVAGHRPAVAPDPIDDLARIRRLLMPQKQFVKPTGEPRQELLF
jgi:hypothetical protein